MWVDQHMSVTLWIGGAFLLNLLVGAVLVAGVYKLMEQRVVMGAFGGVAIGTAVIYAEATLGERMLVVTVGEMKLLVLAAAAGSVLGVLGTMLVFKPEL